jgi:hypothetical protein
VKTPIEIIFELFVSHGVEFILIRGRAEALYGSTRRTYDTDVCYRRTAENLRRLAELLPHLEPKLRGAPPDLPFRLDAESLALGCNYTFRTNAGDLDLIGHVEPIGGFEELVKRAETIRLGELEIKVAALDDLIRIKQHINRPKDRESLIHLLAIKRVRDEESDRVRRKTE